MCGITGKISFNSRNVSSSEIARMNTAISHRGPDDSGIYISPDQKVGLGHQRLSIIDLSPRGHQPMTYLNRYAIVFNGEIYNFKKQKSFLEKQGYQFNSDSDTEVLLALYDRYKERCLEHLRGMFAFAIYDTTEQTFFIARDRVGQKPFKYYYDGSVFMFASELKAILTQPEYKREPDYLAIHHYLSLQYVPSPLTGFKNIKKLPPAHYLKLDIKNNKLNIQRYWQVDYTKKLNLTEHSWQKRIINKLDESVQLRMISDVPLGAFLSGGIDSSAIVALMSRHSNHPIKTFSIGFKEAKYNELKYASIIAKKFNTDHTEFIVEPKAIDILPDLVRQYEEPYADSSALPTYYLSKLTRQHVTVALNGDGGDENFAGYPWYSIQKFALSLEHLRHLAQAAGLPAAYLMRAVAKNNFTARALRFAQTYSQPYQYRYLNYICYFTNQLKETLYSPKMRHALLTHDTHNLIAQQFQSALACNPLDQTLSVDISTYLPDDLLVKVDIATMAVALEGRSPFLDHEFMELTAQIPFNLKLKGSNDKKYIFKKALDNILPPDIMYRPKMGFGVPIDHWFRADLNSYARDLLLGADSRVHQLFNKSAIERLFHDHEQKKTNNAPRIWSLLTLELWLREYFTSL